jgi:hypothetical protein
MMRTSAPLCKRWVANVCLKVCTVTCLLKPAAAQAERQAACKNRPPERVPRAQCLPNWTASVSETALRTGLVWGLSSRSRRLTLMMSVAFGSAK